MNPATVKIIDNYQQKVGNKFLYICKFKESNAKAIFRAIDVSILKYGVLWDKCVLLGLGNPSLNVGHYN